MEACPKCQCTFEPGVLECPSCGISIAPPRAIPPPSRPAPAKPVDRYALPVLRLPPRPPPPEGAPNALRPAAAPVRSVPVVDLITPETFDAFRATLPWLRVVVGVGFGLGFLLFVAGGVLLMSRSLSRGTNILALACLLEAGISVAVFVPLGRSTFILERVLRDRKSTAVEAYVLQQVDFWRRTGVMYVTLLCVTLVSIGLVLLWKRS